MLMGDRVKCLGKMKKNCINFLAFIQSRLNAMNEYGKLGITGMTLSESMLIVSYKTLFVKMGHYMAVNYKCQYLTNNGCKIYRAIITRSFMTS